ncbi:3-isopropylmalate dehydratase large subunit [Amycolatopsis jejuensis]|uniref:3-isopropylmalate dehydratase large subunit n=1 Tax=Amycolatopsis jejuensis TaxID=330084 RepID=UPI0005247E95|nr:aconitase family protein [Amycolatopsis jejuensis]
MAAPRAQTMTSKLLARAAGTGRADPGAIVLPAVDLVTCPDGTTFIDTFEANGWHVWDPAKVIFCFDHTFQPDWMPAAAVREHPKIRKFAAAEGIPPGQVYDFGRNGLSHQIPVEDGWALPGSVVIGLDTQSSTMGAVNCFAMPSMWGTDAILLTGDVWLQVPEAIDVRLEGELPPGVTGKDVGYQLLRDLAGVVNGRVVEFSGPGIASLSVDVRMAIANSAVQTGALTMIFPPDDRLLSYVRPRARKPFEPVSPDADAPYVLTHTVDLSAVRPLVAGPHDITRVRELDDVLGLGLDAVNIGSCSSGRHSDLALAAEILRGRSVADGVRLVVTPISAAVAREAAADGTLATLLAAGATVTQPGCGGCYHGNLSPLKLGDGERCLSTSVETLRGRMGSSAAEILLGNAAVAAASAIAGVIADPAAYLPEGARS